MHHPNGCTDVELIVAIGEDEISISRARRRQLRFIHEFDLREAWAQDGCRHMGQWLAAHLGISVSEGLRRTKAAHALERLPLLAEAFEKGILGFEKVVQLARYLDPDTEADEIRWAEKARLDEIKRKADVGNRPTLDETQLNEVSRYLALYDDEYGNLGLSGRLPAAEGALFKAAIEEMRKQIPVMPDEEPDEECLQADALLALTVGRGDGAETPQRATVVVHADLAALVDADKGAEIAGGRVIAPEVASRMLCDCDLELAVHDQRGNVVGIGRASRQVPVWLRRQLANRDGGCTFPGCGTNRFTQAHHVVAWEHGGPTDLDNLVTVCHFHHKLVHEFAWTVALDEAQRAVWTRPDGEPFSPRVRSGPRQEATAAAEPEDQREWGLKPESLRPVRYPGLARASGFS